jgi:predicted CopG family antitoxin
MPEQETTKTMTVSLSTWQRLSQIKIDNNLQSLDEVIENLLKGNKK